jgi:hypothetical protein
LAILLTSFLAYSVVRYSVFQYSELLAHKRTNIVPIVWVKSLSRARELAVC